MIYLSKAEYARFMNVVNTYYFDRFKNKKFATVLIDNIVYYFRINDFDDYTIISKGKADV